MNPKLCVYCAKNLWGIAVCDPDGKCFSDHQNRPNWVDRDSVVGGSLPLPTEPQSISAKDIPTPSTDKPLPDVLDQTDTSLTIPLPTTPQARAALEIALANIAVLDAKQQDYGPGNIAAFGEFGCLVRANDKIERLKHLLRTGNAPKNESVEDAWLDLANYAVIAVLCRSGKWSKE